MNYERLKFSIPDLRLFFIVGFIFCGLSTPAAGADGHHHGAHVHGVALLNLALENNELYIEIKSPAANIVGFEHPPRTEMEKSAVEQAVKTLKAGEDLFTFSTSAGAVLKESTVMVGMENDSGHEDEDHSSETDHHATHEVEDHKQHDVDEQHSEFEVVYRFHCKYPDKLKYIDVMLFDRFKGIEEINVQMMTRKRQTAFDLTLNENRITF